MQIYQESAYIPQLVSYGWHPHGAPDGHLNTFHGLPFKPLDPFQGTEAERVLLERIVKFPRITDDNGDFKRYDMTNFEGGHLHTVIGNDTQESTKYIFSFMAHIFQKMRKCRVLMTLYSDTQQCGKGAIFGSGIGENGSLYKKIMGETLYCPKDRMNELNGYCGRFNLLFEAKLLNVFDEQGNFFGDKKVAKDFTRLIQADEIQWKDENEQPRPGIDYANCIAMTNDLYTTPTTKGQCRNGLFQISEYYSVKSATDGGYLDERKRFLRI